MIKLAKKKSKSDWVKVDNVEFLIDYPTNSQEIELQDIAFNLSLDQTVRQLKYARQYLKFVIKDWKGIDEKCLVINNELENDLWEGLCKDSEQVLTIFGVIFKELEVTDADKKKS